MSPIGNLGDSPTSSGLTGMGRVTADMPPFQPQDLRTLARKQAESAMEQIRTANSIIDSIAEQFPTAADEIKATKALLVKVMGKIVGSQAQPESSPRTGIMG